MNSRFTGAIKVEEQSPFYSMYLSHQANALPPAPEKPASEQLGYEPVPTDMSGADMPPMPGDQPPEPEQKLNVLGEPVEPSELGQTIVEGITDLGRRIVHPFITNPAVQGPIKGATDLVNQISSLDNELGQVLGVYDRDRQPMQLPDITEDMPVASEGGKELIATLTQFLTPFKAAGGFKAGPLTMESFRAGALADALFDPESGNLWDMAKEQGWVPELTQYLSAKVDEEAPAEDRLMSRLKTVFGEGGPLGVAADGIFKLASMAKKAYFPGKEESLQKVQKDDVTAQVMYENGKPVAGVGLFKNFNPIAIRSLDIKNLGKQVVVNMPIKQFLKLANTFDDGLPEDYKMRGLSNVEKYDDIPYLMFDVPKNGIAQVRSHEGRHRAVKLLERGETTMPVAISVDATERTKIAWDSQTNPKDYYYSDVFPEKMIGETNSESYKTGEVFDFPVKRGEYGIVTTSKGDN